MRGDAQPIQAQADQQRRFETFRIAQTPFGCAGGGLYNEAGAVTSARLCVGQLCLRLFGSANRAGTGASAAIDANIGIDDVLAVTFGNSANGAIGSASAASNAIVRNFESHGSYLLIRRASTLAVILSKSGCVFKSNYLAAQSLFAGAGLSAGSRLGCGRGVLLAGWRGAPLGCVGLAPPFAALPPLPVFPALPPER